MNNKPTFLNQLEQLINAYSKENGSDTPDWVLAEYLQACLEAYDNATNQRTHYYRKVEKEAIYQQRVSDLVETSPKATDE